METDNVKTYRFTGVAYEDILMGQAVEVRYDATRTTLGARPLVQLAQADDTATTVGQLKAEHNTYIGVAMADAAEGETIEIRCWNAGTLSGRVALTADIYAGQVMRWDGDYFIPCPGGEEDTFTCVNIRPISNVTGLNEGLCELYPMLGGRYYLA